MHASLAAEHGAANVYLLSRRFLEWATPERLSGDFARSILAAGGSVERELAEARRQIQLEYEDLAAWLRLKGVKDLGPESLRGAGRADPRGILSAARLVGHDQAGRVHSPALNQPDGQTSPSTS